MSTIQEATRNTAVVIDSSASNSQVEAEPDVFARELETKLEAGASRQDRMAATMERLAASFPGVSITNSFMSGFGEAREYYLRTGDAASINIGPDMLSQMTDDSGTFDRVKNLINTLLGVGQQQNLVNAGGSDIHRNVSIQNEEVRYVEVQRTTTGTQLSVSSLAMETEQVVSDTLNQLFGIRNQGDSFTGGIVTSQSASTGFQNFVGNSTSWRFESVLTAQGLTNLNGRSAGSFGIGQLVGQTRAASLEVIIRQWSSSSSASGASGMDLMAYIQMMGLSDPLVLDLGDEGINLTSAEDGVYFDIKGDGSPVRTAFIQGNNALLYLDRNGNGVADDATELFGDQGGFADGYEMLSQFDENDDGIIDKRDSIFHELRVWRDLNRDGVNQAEESMSLAEAGIQSLNLRHDGSGERDAHGNVIAGRSNFTRTDGSQGLMAEAWFRTLRDGR